MGIWAPPAFAEEPRNGAGYNGAAFGRHGFRLAIAGRQGGRGSCRRAFARLAWCRQSAALYGRPIGRLKMGGGVAPAEWRVQRTPNGALSMPSQSAGPVPARQPPGGALSGGIPPDIMRGGAGAGPPGGPGRRRDSGGGMQWLPIGGMPARRGDGPGGHGARWNGAGHYGAGNGAS